jgi:hypothetical protein
MIVIKDPAQEADCRTRLNSAVGSIISTEPFNDFKAGGANFKPPAPDIHEIPESNSRRNTPAKHK